MSVEPIITIAAVTIGIVIAIIFIFFVAGPFVCGSTNVCWGRDVVCPLLIGRVVGWFIDAVTLGQGGRIASGVACSGLRF